MKPVLEINRELVVSTRHISQETDAWLSSGEQGAICHYDFEYGHRILVTSDEQLLAEEIKLLWKEGRGELAELIRLASCNDCKWLVLDADGPEICGRPEFDW